MLKSIVPVSYGREGDGIENAKRRLFQNEKYTHASGGESHSLFNSELYRTWRGFIKMDIKNQDRDMRERFSLPAIF